MFDQDSIHAVNSLKEEKGHFEELLATIREYRELLEQRRQDLQVLKKALLIEDAQ